jgi:ribosome-associated heat shock protein Hsp15
VGSALSDQPCALFTTVAALYIRAVDGTRIDQWLNAARIFKSRTSAGEACVGGKVKINDIAVARSSHVVRVGDEIRAQAPRGLVVLKVLAIAEKRLSPPLARQLYEDHSPPPEPREFKITGVRDRGAGRPTKAERRAIERLRSR